MKLITDILRDYRKGQLVDDASEEMQAVVRAVLETGKPGEVAIVLKIRPNKNDTSFVFMDGEIKAKSPKEPLPTAIYYADSTGDLHRSDPKQENMMFSEAEDKVERRVLHTHKEG